MPLAKITIDMEKPSQWVSKLCRLYFADEFARRTVGVPSATQVPDIETAPKAVQKILPKLEARMIEFLAEWFGTFLIPATHVLEVMFLKDYWFRELYLGLKVTASFDRSESYTRVIDGQVRCNTQKLSRRTSRSSGTFSLSPCLSRMDDPSCLPQPAQGKHQGREFRQCNRCPVCPLHLV